MSSNAELIDEAAELIREVLHRHDTDPLCRKHLDRAMSHVREAWIANDGQKARSISDLTKDMDAGDCLMKWSEEKALKEEARKPQVIRFAKLQNQTGSVPSIHS